MTTQKEIVLGVLKKHPLTNIEIQQLVFTTSPHGIIRSIRNEYGYDAIYSEHCFKHKTYTDENGKQRREYKTWVKYIWKGAQDEKAVNE